MARPRITGTREATIADLREEFLDRCRAQEPERSHHRVVRDRTRRFSDWCLNQGILRAQDLATDDLEAYVLSVQAGPYEPQAVKGFAQAAKTVARYGHRKGLIPADLTRDFEMPKVPQTIIETFSDEQLEALINQPDQCRWKGVRDRAILLTLLDTMARVSELAGVNASHVDLEGRSIRVLGKGRKERDLPIGKTAARALQRYRNAVDGLQPGDPFFISYRGRRLDPSVITDMVADCSDRAATSCASAADVLSDGTLGPPLRIRLERSSFVSCVLAATRGTGTASKGTLGRCQVLGRLFLDEVLSPPLDA